MVRHDKLNELSKVYYKRVAKFGLGSNVLNFDSVFSHCLIVGSSFHISDLFPSSFAFSILIWAGEENCKLYSFIPC